MRREAFEDGFYEEFGLGAGDEDGGGDVEGEAVELLGAGDVLDGFDGEAAGDALLVEDSSSSVSWRVGSARSWARVMPRWWRRRSSASRRASF